LWPISLSPQFVDEAADFLFYMFCKVIDRLTIHARSSLRAADLRKRFAEGKVAEKSIIQTVVDSAHRLVPCVIRVEASSQHVRLFRLCMTRAIPDGQSASEANDYFASAGLSSRAVSPGTAREVPEGATFTGAACCSIGLLETLPRNFSPSQQPMLLAIGRPSEQCLLVKRRQTSSRFCPPNGYPASQAATYSLLRDHLSPHTTSAAS